MSFHTSTLFTFSCLLLLFACSNGQSSETVHIAEGKGGPVTNDGHFTEFVININDSNSSKLTTDFGLKEVLIDLEHQDDSEIVIYLKAPDGTEVELTYVNGTGGQNYRNTCFADDAEKPIKCAAPPFTGRFRPVDYLGSINNGQSMNGQWKLLVKDWKPSPYSGNLIMWKLTFDKNAPSPVLLTESDLPVIVIDTRNKAIPDSPRINADMGIIYRKGSKNRIGDPFNNYNGRITIETRGSSSQNYSKKSYALTLVDSAGNKKDHKLLDLPAEKDFVLYAPYSDKSLIRNYLAYELYKKQGQYSPRAEFVELIVNGDYKGVYMLTEKIKRDEQRVNVAKWDTSGKDPVSLTGGYIIKIDRYQNPEEGFFSSIPASFNGTKKIFFSYCYPDEKEITESHKKYLRSFIDSFETSISSVNYSSEGKYRKYIDLRSFADYLLINELSKNVDSYKLSTYLYKNRDNIDSKLHIGPIWDFDLAFNNANYGDASNPAGWQFNFPDTVYPVPQWWARLMNDPAFTGVLKERWKTLRKTTFSTSAINTLIDSKAGQLATAAERNFRKWPVLGSQVGMNPEPLPKDYKGEIQHLKKWIQERTAWMDEEIAKLK